MMAAVSSAVRFGRSVEQFSQAARGMYPGPPVPADHLVSAIRATEGTDGGQLSAQTAAATGSGRPRIGGSFFEGMAGA
ncbi:MAG TPA: hypothetical protein VFC72_00105, partial [Corynebacterium sp.]|nr:hypothetical protein [Corynebacterium sp.]